MEHTFSSQPEYVAASTAQKLKELIPNVSVSEARVAQFILLNLDQISFETGASIAEKAAVSQITVSRFLKRAGYQGISALKEALKKELLHADGVNTERLPVNAFYKENFKNELQAMMRLYEQFESGGWEAMVGCIDAAKRVYVTGFQSIRGTAEDVARRLSLARDCVQYLSPHDGMLAEWLETKSYRRQDYDVLIVLDIVPYASECRRLCEEAVRKGIQVVIITDEFCHWAVEVTPHVFYSKSKSGLFLESTWGIVMATNMLVHCVANKNPDSEERIKRWHTMAKRLSLF
ncbi:MurR/RpiR family transcriptional regulator [Vibrio sp.]|uniref:MurR/RpiR family transcriptional regulator n=1 Tax=Vibrio viridaestus TaxID=2487322 RepID=A0A3N9U549_9VIBR|nr:MurR/RpiR family transcriptional regulator [Vibrio viridaestus]MDC0612048.1 MurR/RpiR family transcriptional regulator [Vibrio sp.]RQW64822.1 MurR/RpiR family transcriptional regulator [Vibrio viridaestus]